MKKVIFIVSCIAVVASCNQKEAQKALSNNDGGPAEYALPLDTAVAFTHRYNDIAKAILRDSTPIKAYTIRAVDLLEALGMPLTYVNEAKYDYVRVYIGMDSHNKFRLLLTPVEGANISQEMAGNDVILDGPFTSGDGTSGAPILNGSYVMDFTGPCPNSCSNISPLNCK